MRKYRNTRTFWGLFEPENEHEKKEVDEAVTAFNEFFNSLALPDVPNEPEINFFLEEISRIGEDYADVGGADTEVRNGLLTLLRRHYHPKQYDCLSLL